METKKKDGKPYKFKRATRKKMSLAHTGKKLSPETRAKISAARQERQSLIAMGLLKPYKHSPATRKKLSRIMKKLKHRPSRKAIKSSAEERGNRRKDKLLAKKVLKGQL